MDLREFLFKYNVTVEGFAKYIGYTKTHISQISNGRTQPSKRLAREILRACKGEVTLEELMNPKPRPPLNENFILEENLTETIVNS